MVARIGPVSAKFKGKLSLSDLEPPNSYAIAFEGQGGAAGFGKGSAQVQLAPDGEGTRLSYQVKANVGGKLAQIGSRLVDAAARKISQDFFAAFNEKVAALHGAHGAEAHDEHHARARAARPGPAHGIGRLAGVPRRGVAGGVRGGAVRALRLKPPVGHGAPPVPPAARRRHYFLPGPERPA